MESNSNHALKQRTVASFVIDTLGTAPVWARTEGLTRGAILDGLTGDVESLESTEALDAIRLTA